MVTTVEGTWLRAEPAVELVRLSPDGDRYTAEIDRPTAMKFREPIPVVAGTPLPASGPDRDHVEVVDDRVSIVDSAGARWPLRRVVPPRGDAFAASCGWYERDGRVVLLAQIPEEYFGEPMFLIQEGDAVTRAYPIDEQHLVRADGQHVELTTHDPAGRPALRIGDQLLRKTERCLERQVSFAVGGEALAGTLIVPAGAGPHPAAVIVHGAAGGQRDSCRLFADALLDAGVAALIYDKAGHGNSQGPSDPTIFDQADAVSAALDLLAGLPDIDAGRIGLLGFSNGMWAAPIVAARRPDIAFLAGVGSPGVTMAESEVHRRTKVLRDAGVGEDTLATVATAWRAIFAVAATGSATEASTARLAELLAELSHEPELKSYEIPEYVRQNPMLSPVPPQVPVADLIGMLIGQPSPELAHDPAGDYRRLRCPVFLQYGSLDTSVPVTVSIERIAAALPASHGPHSTIVVYPHLEHQLNVLPDAVTGMSPEEAAYLFHAFRYGPRVKADLTTWLRTAVRG